MSHDDDPFEAHFHRDPMRRSGVRVVLLDEDGTAPNDSPPSELAALLRKLGRSCDVVVERTRDEGGYGRALECAIRNAPHALVLVTTARQGWTEAHLTPLLDAIDRADHVLGRRPRTGRERAARAAWGLLWRLLFALPVKDVQSPCRLHRLDKLAAIPIQSEGPFAEIEVLAKATFLGHLIDEVAVPPLEPAGPRPRGRLRDFLTVFRKPTFVRDSIPTEQAQGQDEGDDGPGPQDQQGGRDISEPRPLEDHPAQRGDALRER